MVESFMLNGRTGKVSRQTLRPLDEIEKIDTNQKDKSRLWA